MWRGLVGKGMVSCSLFQGMCAWGCVLIIGLLLRANATSIMRDFLANCFLVIYWPLAICADLSFLMKFYRKNGRYTTTEERHCCDKNMTYFYISTCDIFTTLFA